LRGLFRGKDEGTKPWWGAWVPWKGV